MPDETTMNQSPGIIIIYSYAMTKRDRQTDRHADKQTRQSDR